MASWWMAGVAAAQSVVLVPPKQDDVVLLDAFHRLEAELHIHHFETVLVERDLDAAGSTSLGSLAEQRHALAAIALSRRAGQPTLDLWLVDQATGESRVRTLGAGQGADATSLIAVRAVDLLRASLGEFVPDAPLEEETQPRVEPRPEPEPPPPTAAATPDVPLWLSIEACMLRPGARFGIGVGPALAMFYRTAPWLHVGISLAAPLTAMTLDRPSGSPSIHQELAALEVRFPIVRAGPFSAGPEIGVGAYLLQAIGHANAPLVSQNDQLAAVLLSLAAQAELRILPRLAATLSVRAIVLAPRVGVAIRTDLTPIDQPALEASLGVAVGL